MSKAIYVVEGAGSVVYAIKSTLKGAKVYADWLIDKNLVNTGICILKRRLKKVSDLRGDGVDKPENLFDDVYMLERVYGRNSKGRWV